MENRARQEEQEFGKDHGLIHEVIITGRKVGASHSFWSKLAHDEHSFRKVVELVDAGTDVRTTLSVVVDCDLSLSEMIRVGKYNVVDRNIIERLFPIRGEGDNEFVVELFHFNWVMKSDDVLVEMDKAGYRPTVIEEFLAFGAQHPKEQEEHPIAALGSVWDNPACGHQVPYLWGGVSGRSLNLRWIGDAWHESYRFTAVRKAD